MKHAALRVGVAGLGRAFTFMLPTFLRDPRLRLVAATDPLPAPRARFTADFGGPAYETIEPLCADPNVDVVYIATPHGFHADHACLALAHGKHVLVEKPMACRLPECDTMIAAAQAAGRHLIVGHSHSFDRPIARAREIIDGGDFGAVRMINALYCTDFMYRARRPEELRTEDGGGVIFNQAAHQIDIVRLLGGGLVRSVRATTGVWDPARPTEGAYSALLTFGNGSFATAAYSGYGHYDGDELMENFDEMGRPKHPGDYGGARRRLAEFGAGVDEASVKATRNYGGSAYVPSTDTVSTAHQHFGFVLVCCERGDLRPTPTGIFTYGDRERRFEPIPSTGIPRIEVVDELSRAVVDDVAPLHSGAWAKATLEACLAMLDSARTGRDIELRHQCLPQA